MSTETVTDTGEAAETPEAAEPQAVEPVESEAAEPEAGVSWARRLRLPLILLAVAVVLAGAGVWFTVQARSLTAGTATANHALTDVGATAEVTSAVSLALNKVFSYSYDRTEVTEKAAAEVLRGQARDSYDKLFAQVREKAPQQKLILTSRVSSAAVQFLDEHRSTLLVFLDQSAVRADNNAADAAAAQLSVTAERSGRTWVITDLAPR